MKNSKIFYLILLITTSIYSQSPGRDPGINMNILSNIRQYLNLQKNLSKVETQKITRQLSKGYNTTIKLLDNKKLKLYHDKELINFYKEVEPNDYFLFKGIQENSKGFIYKFEKNSIYYYSDLNTMDHIDTFSDSYGLYYIHTVLKDIISDYQEKDFFHSNLAPLKPVDSNFDSPELIFDLFYFIKRKKKIKSPLSLEIKLTTKINSLAEVKGRGEIELRINDLNYLVRPRYTHGASNDKTEIFFFEEQNYGMLFGLNKINSIETIKVTIKSGGFYAVFNLPKKYIDKIENMINTHRKLVF
ncbi:hypothetical protein ABW636_14050 [Aquimarina sp. 2201CG1-2-11]|uniref:hypothetical protein n=1 Tax=Aquimarina discodermiae TaxID=3231043 RepID=UPI003462AEA3